MVYATDETYKELVQDGIVIVDFFGKTCVPCKMIAPILEDLEDELPFVKVVKVDVDECPKTAEEFDIEGIPDLYFYKDGEIFTHQTGAVGSDDLKAILAHIIY